MSVFLVPCPISEEKIETIPPHTIAILHRIRHFIVEKAKTARHFIKASGHPVPLSELDIFEMDKHQPESGLYEHLQKTALSFDIGVISEAGCPGIADPGTRITAWAHARGIEVKPLTGPSSVLLALMASGFSGQSFTFNGYLPQNREMLIRSLKELEKAAEKSGSTQIFIETPYRNKSLISTCCKCLKPHTMLSVAVDLTGDKEKTVTMNIANWRKADLERYHKKPAVFLIGKNKFREDITYTKNIL